jgi:hypothetical protein
MYDFGGNSTLVPNRAAMVAFLEHCFGGYLDGLHDGLIEISHVENQGDKPNEHWRSRLFGTDEIEEAADFAVEMNLKRRNIYVAPALRLPDADRNKRALKDQVMGTVILWCEWDDAIDFEEAQKKYQFVKPTAGIITGLKPHRRCQAFWRLDEALYDKDEIDGALAGLQTALFGDPKVTHADCLMRLAGGISWRKLDKPDRVDELTLLAVGQDGMPPSYPAAQVLQAFPPAERQSDGSLFNRPEEIERHKSALGFSGSVKDGRETYMRNTVLACLTEYAGTHGCWPAAQQLFDMAWPQYSRNTDFAKPGRDEKELFGKCRYTVRRAEREQITNRDGSKMTLESAAASYQKKRTENTSESEKTAQEQQHNDFIIYDVNDDFCSGVPPRQWLYGTKLIRDFCTLLVSPGGVGKTAFTVGLSVSCQMGRQILADKPHKPMNVWGFYLEEPKEEIQRRMKAARMVYQPSISDPAPGRLMVSSGRDQQLLVAKSIGKDEFVVTPDVANLEKHILENNVDILIIDPFVKTHTIEENNNVLIEKVVTIFNELAGRTHCSILLVHHTRKGAQAGEAESSRGASSIVGNVRAAFTLAPMSSEDAKELGVSGDEKRFLIRLDDAKANMAPKSEKAEWIKLLSQNLGNATEEYPSGDNVQVVSSWLPPDLWEGVSIQTANQILDTIAGGQPQEDGTVEYYTSQKNSKSRWAGIPIMRILAENGQERTEGQVQQIINRWLKSDPPILEVSEYLSGRGKEKRQCLIVNHANRPGAK